MNRLITALVLLMGLSAWGQPIQRNFFDTNVNPIVDVVAGSNAFITPILIGTDTRRFKIDVPMSGAATNVFQSGTTNGSYIFIITNGFNYEFALDRSITNGLVNSSVTNGLATTNWVGANFLLQSAAPTTNGFVTSSVTNGLATTNWVGSNFALQSSIPSTNGFVTASVTNGLATTNWVGANYQTIAGAATTNGFVDASVTNGLLGSGTAAATYQTIALAATTNGFVGSGVTNGLLGSGTAAATYLPLAGGTVTGPVLSTSTSTNAPAGNEFPVAGWVRGLFNNGVLDYATTNIDSVATNLGVPTPVYTFATTIPPSSSRSYVNPTNNQYIGSVITTNTFQFLQGPISVNAFMALSTGGADAIQVHPEIYYSYDRTNWNGDWEANNQSITKGATNLYQWVISFPAVTSTNSTGFYLERRFKAANPGGTPTVTFLVGTNTASGTNDASHISFSGPNSGNGNAYLANNQTFTGTNTFTQTIIGSITGNAATATNVIQTLFTNLTIYGDTQRTNAVYVSGSGEVLSNAVGSVTIAGGNVTASGTFGGGGGGLSNLFNSIQTICGSGGPAFTATTQYLNVTGSQASSAPVNISTPFIRGGLLTNLAIRTVGLGAGTNMTFVVMTNEQPSNLTVSYNGTGNPQGSSNTTSSVTIPANCTIAVGAYGNNATANATRFMWSFEKLNQ